MKLLYLIVLGKVIVCSGIGIAFDAFIPLLFLLLLGGPFLCVVDCMVILESAVQNIYDGKTALYMFGETDENRPVRQQIQYGTACQIRLSFALAPDGRTVSTVAYIAPSG